MNRPTVFESQADLSQVVKRFIATASNAAHIDGKDVQSEMCKRNAGADLSAIYASEMAPRWRHIFDDRTLSAALTAADSVSAGLGIVSGTLVALKTFELLKYCFDGLLTRISWEALEKPSLLGATTATRLVNLPTYQTFNAAVNALTGYPWGWAPVTAPQTTDVLLSASEHGGVCIRFDSNALASTSRRLFEEQAAAAAYVLALRCVQLLMASISPTNFNAYAVALPQYVPTPYVTYVVSQGNFGKSSLAAINTALTNNQVPLNNRSVLLAPGWHTQLDLNPSNVQIVDGNPPGEIITDAILPKISSFLPIEAPYLTAFNPTPNLCGFAFHKTALLLKTSPPVALNDVLDGVTLGRSVPIRDEALGITGLLVTYTDHATGTAVWRLETVISAGPGAPASGLVLTSQ